MKKSKKISVLISLVLISILAIGAVSAAEDTAVTDDADLVAVDDVQTVDDAPITDEIDYESNDIIVTDTGDSSDLDDADSDVISDTGLKDDSDDGDEAVVSDASSPKNALKAEPLRGPEDDPVGTYKDLWTLISNAPAGSTITLTQNYAYNPDVDDDWYYRTGSGAIWNPYEYWYCADGLYINKNLVINGNGHYISGGNAARIFDVVGSTLTLNNLILKEGKSSDTRNWNNNHIDGYRQYGGAIYAHGTGVTLNINNCTLTDNHNDGNGQYYSGGAIYSTGTTTILNSILTDNSAYYGGAFTIAGGTFTVHGSVIFDNDATSSTNGFGDNGYRTSGSTNLLYNWWGSNKGAENTIGTTTSGTSLTVNDWFILTETLSSPTTIDVDFELYRGGTTDYKIPARLVTITHDADTCNTTTAYCPDPFVIEFTTSNDAYINASVDHEQQHLKVFAGENKKNITVLRVEVEDVTLPAQPIAHVFSDIDGIYNLTLGTQKFEVNVVNSEGTYQFTNLNVGQYTVIVSRVDDPVYKTTFNTTEFEVKRYATELVIDANTTTPTFGESVEITHELTPEGPTGFITYYVDGSETGTQLSINENFVLSGLSAGAHTVVAKYGGDGSYDVSTSNTLTINVAKAALEVNVTDVSVHYPEKGTINVSSNKDGVYTINVNNAPYQVTVANGKGSFTLEDSLAVGTYDITWDIAATENYTGATGSASYIVLNTAPDFDITGSSSIDYGQTNTITHTINDDATGTITYVVTGQDDVTKSLSEDLELSGLDAGHYTVTATYNGDTNYGPLTKVFEFDVLPIDVDVSVATETVVYPSAGYVNLTVSAPGTYTIRVGTKEYEITVTEAGTYNVPVPYEFEVGEYPISVTAPASTNYKEVDKENIGTYTVTKPATNLIIDVTDFIYGADASATITLKQGETALADKTITVTIEDTQKTFPTDSNGQATVPLSALKAGDHYIVAVFAGDENYALAINSTKVTVNKATPTITVSAEAITYGADATISIALDGVNSEKITGVVKVNIDGKDYDVVVTDGVGTLTVSGLAANAEGYAITATFAGNDNYGEATNTAAKQVVNKATPVVTITSNATTIKYGETVSFSVLSGPADYTGGVVYALGEYEFEGNELSDLHYGTYQINARVVGDDNYIEAAAANVLVITVEKADPTIVISSNATTIKYGESFILSADVTPIDDYGEITFTMDGWVCTPEQTGLPAGTYTFAAQVAEYGDYNEAVSAPITVTVTKADASIGVSYEDGEFTITLDGVNGQKLNETVKVAIDGTAIDPIETDDGVYTFSYAGLAPGRHSILVTFEGNTNYLGDSKNYGFDVDKHTPTLEVFIGNLVYGQDAYIVAELKEGDTGLTGVVEVTISGYEDPFIVAVAEGTGILPIAGLNAGTYTYTAKSVADSTYASATQDERTFVVAPRTVTIEVDTFGGVDFGDEGEIEVRLHDAETDERIKDEVTLIFTDENGNVLETITVETAVGPWDGGERLDFTAEWPMGDYYVTVENPNYIFVKYDESEYKFTSFGDEAGEIEYSTGTVEEIESDDDRWTKVRVLTNDADVSYVGNEYYIDPDVNYDTEQTYQLYVFDEDIDDYVGTGIWVLVHKDLIPDPAKYDYPVHKVGIGVNLVSGDGGYVYGYDHEVVLQLLKYDGDDYEDGEPVEIDCPALVVVFKFNGETEEWEKVLDIVNINFDDGILSMDCTDFKPGEYKLKVSISDDIYELRYWNDEEDREVDYRLFWDDDSLFQVDNDHVYIENVIGEESTRFGDEHDFSFEVWHSHYDEETDDDVRELFVHDFDATVKVYKWNDDTEEYDLVNTIPVEISDGKTQAIDFSDMKVGQYKVTVTLDDPDYAFEERDDDLSEDVDYAIRYFEIYQDNIHANLDGTYWTEYGQERKFKFDLTHWDDDAEEDVLFVYDTSATVKVYKLTWDDEGAESAELIGTYENVAINGGHSDEIDLSDLNAGSYRVTIQLDDEDYALDYWFNGQYGIQEVIFDVSRSNVDIKVEFDKEGYVYGDDVIVTVTITPQRTEEKLTEEIELNIMGKDTIRKNLVDGIATFTLEDYDAGLYTIWVNFFGTENYNDLYNHIGSFIIGKASPVIEVSPRESEYAYGEDAVIDVTFKDGDNGLSGTAIVTVDGTDYVVNIEDGEGTLTISGLDANEEGYGIAARVAGTDNYNSVQYEGDAKVVVVKSDDAQVDVKLEGDQIVVSLTGANNEPLDGTVNVAIDGGEAVPVTVTNGQGTLDASSLTAGEHTVTATSVADDNYESATITKTIEKGSAPKEAAITVTVEDIVYGNDAVVQVTFTDMKTGAALQETLTVTIGDIEKTVTIGEDGTGSVNVDGLNVGHHIAVVSFAGDSTYQAISKDDGFDVIKATTVIESEDIVVTANVGQTMEFTLKDQNGVLLAGKTITLTFNGQTFERTSDENGKFTVEINMANQGTYTISASYAGEANYESATASYNVVVKPIATKLTVSDVTYGLSDTKYLTATLTAGDEPLANRIITFSLNGKTYTGRTNAQGVVRIAVSLTAKKTYSVVASYGGDNTYGSAMAIYKLKVTK